MTELVHADIFFFITSIAVVVISILMVIALIYVIRIIKDLSHISDLARKESEEIAKDVKEFREDIRFHRHSFKSAVMLFLKKIAPRTKRGAHTANKHDNMNMHEKTK